LVTPAASCGARVLPGKRSRWLKLAQRHWALFERAVGVLGLEYFEEVLAGFGDFEWPLWNIIEDYRLTDNQPRQRIQP
jgi:hypothetical protein